MIDQLIIGDKASFDDFGASLARNSKQPPEKKSIKEKVPFSNVTYDFSAINGELYWEERELEYAFEILADTPEELEEKKTAFSSWIMNITKENIYDPFIPYHHFLGTYESMKYDDEEDMEKTTATVVFSAYPYQIANTPKVYSVTIPANSEKEIYIENISSHRITPTITTSGEISLKIGNATFTMGEGTYNDSKVKLSAGLSSVIVNTKSAACTVELKFYEEVF